MENGKIFISYRREDTSGESGRLKDTLEQIFGKENIFYDVETLEAGLNFDQSIAKALNESKVLLAMIGPHWLKVTDSKGEKRINKPDDWVRKEIAEALKRNLRVIPILVNGADMPDSEELPEDIKELSLKHAQELTSSRWSYDVGVLSKVLEKLITKNPEPIPQPNPEPRPIQKNFDAPNPHPKNWWAKNYKWAIGGLILLLVIYLIIPSETTEYDVSTDPNIEAEVPADFDQEIMIPDMVGDWVLNLEGVDGNWVSTCVFVQDGSNVTFKEYNPDGKPIGEGSGQTDGLDMVLDYYSSADQLNGTITLSTNNSGQTWIGELNYPSTGDTYKSVLSRN